MIDENFKLTNQQLKLYLDRLEIEQPDPTPENLEKIQTIHISKIPYENLSILLGEPISLNGNDLFEKIIVNKRGGYCFEVNGLYSFLLKALGYKVTTFNTRFIYEGMGVQVRRHRIMKVDFDNCSYIADASFRLESPRKALKLEYDLVQTDFILPNYYCETHPDSPFINYPILSLFPNGRHVIISDQTLTIYSEENIPTKKNINSTREFASYVEKYFDIKLSDSDMEKIRRKKYFINE